MKKQPGRPPIYGEAQIGVYVRLPVSLKSRLDALGGTRNAHIIAALQVYLRSKEGAHGTAEGSEKTICRP